MQLIPQIYLKDGKVVLKGGVRSALFSEDPMATAAAMKTAGAETLHFVDLATAAVGASIHAPVINKIIRELKIAAFVDGTFKTPQAVEAYVNAGVDFVVQGTLAYQQPAFLKEICDQFPNKIGAHIDLKGGHVTIPGYAVVTKKTPLDYAKQFLDAGVRYILYSDIRADGTMGDENFKSILEFCKNVTARITITSEISNLSDIQKIITLSAPRLDGIVLGKSLTEDKIDLKSAVVMVNDLIIGSGNEETLADM
ncbi:MAG: HisA/HisF-related TIM barrel protein [bacterium]